MNGSARVGVREGRVCHTGDVWRKRKGIRNERQEWGKVIWKR